MKKIIVVYDDSRVPGQEINAVTGKKSYGNIIFKRQSLKDRAREIINGTDAVSDFVTPAELSDSRVLLHETDAAVFKIYSDHEVSDRKALKVLLEKSLYAKEAYSVYCNDKIAAVIYPGIREYTKQDDVSEESGYSRIESGAFVDLSDIDSFRTFITSGFDARFFNALKGDEYTVVKSSDNISKIRREYDYYTMLPQSMKQWFVNVFDYTEENGRAAYSMERYHMTDLALRYVHGAIDEDEFRGIMERLFHFIAARVTKEVDDEEYERNARALYIDKVRDRIAQLKDLKGYDKIREYIAAGTDYDDIDGIFDRYMQLYEKITADRKFIKVLALSHGDLCFSNILYNHDVRLLRLIDPKGAESEDEMYMNPYYDIAKLSHSICGSYDYFNSDQYEIVMGPDMKLSLKIYCDNDSYMGIFREFLSDNGFDIKLIRLYEASLFLSMLPLHMDREKKVLGFVLNAVDILDELSRETD